MGTYLTKGTTFTTGATVTAASLNNLVDNATVTAGSIGSAELGSNSVTADKISTSSPEPVTTGTIRDNAVNNSKLNNMGPQTVKVNATNGSADPTDLGMIGGGTNGSSKILMGTSNSINALTASQFKMVNSGSSYADATNNTATDLRLHTTAVDDWATVAAATDVHDDNDRLLFYDADGTSASVASLKQISPKKLIQSLPALTTTSGVVRLATTERAIAPDTVGTVDADVLTVNQSASMLTKAWVEFTSSGSDIAQTITNSFNITSLTRATEGIYNILFATDLPSDKYVVVATGYKSSNENLLFGRITSRTATGVGCTVKFGQYDDVLAVKDPTGVATLIFYGLTS
jgi:hypothetical protein